MNIRFLLRFFTISSLLFLVACATTGEQQKPKQSENNPVDLEASAELDSGDPHESINRKVYIFNKGLDTYVSSPIVTVYHFISPGFLRTSVANFFTNLKEPRTVVNDALQGKEKPAGEDFERFVINTLFGLGGLVDVATYAEIEYHEEDFSQTLAVWGVPRGKYLVIPFLGPSSYRGVPGKAVDAISNPVTYAMWPFQVLDLINTRSNAEQSLQFIDEAAVDPYVFMRASYLQWRDFQITEGESSADNILVPDMFDDEDLELLEEDLDIQL